MKSPPPQISILLQTKFVPVFLDLQKKIWVLLTRGKSCFFPAQFEDFPQILIFYLIGLESNYCSNITQTLIVPQAFLSWQTSELSRPASYANFGKFWLLRFARLSKKCQNCATLLNWIFNYSFIRVICYLSAKFSFTFIFLSRRERQVEKFKLLEERFYFYDQKYRSLHVFQDFYVIKLSNIQKLSITSKNSETI